MKNKNIQYTIYRDIRHPLLKLSISILFLVLPFLIGFLTSDVRIIAFCMIGILLLVYCLYETLYLRNTCIVIRPKEIEIRKPFSKKIFLRQNIYWTARRIGFREGYKIILKNNTKTVIKIDLDWENLQYVLYLKQKYPLSSSDKEVIKIIHRNY